MKITIILVVLFGLAAVGASIYVGSRSFDGLVVDKPYETGLQWDRTRRESAETGWKADVAGNRLTTGNSELKLSVRDASGKPLKGADITVTVSRPASRQYDKNYKAVPANDHYSTDVIFPFYGYWDIKINIAKEGRHAAFEKRVFAEKG